MRRGAGNPEAEKGIKRERSRGNGVLVRTGNARFLHIAADEKQAEAAAAASACIICAGKGVPFPNKGCRRCIPEKHQKKFFTRVRSAGAAARVP